MLAHKGVIDVDWTKIGGALTEQLDVNNDGELNHKDLTSSMKDLVKFAGNRMPWAASFSVGFYGGLR